MSLALAKPQLDAIAAACRRHHVARLHAFGSVLRCDFRPGESDIDLLVEFLPLQPIELADAYFGLEHQLPEKLDSPVDLVMADAVRNPIVQQRSIMAQTARAVAGLSHIDEGLWEHDFDDNHTGSPHRLQILQRPQLGICSDQGRSQLQGGGPDQTIGWIAVLKP